jgi:hypothetical protein
VQAGSNSPGHGFQQPPQQPQQAGAACFGRHTIGGWQAGGQAARLAGRETRVS